MPSGDANHFRPNVRQGLFEELVASTKDSKAKTTTLKGIGRLKARPLLHVRAVTFLSATLTTLPGRPSRSHPRATVHSRLTTAQSHQQTKWRAMPM